MVFVENKTTSLVSASAYSFVSEHRTNSVQLSTQYITPYLRTYIHWRRECFGVMISRPEPDDEEEEKETIPFQGIVNGATTRFTLRALFVYFWGLQRPLHLAPVVRATYRRLNSGADLPGYGITRWYVMGRSYSPICTGIRWASFGPFSTSRLWFQHLTTLAKHDAYLQLTSLRLVFFRSWLLVLHLFSSRRQFFEKATMRRITEYFPSTFFCSSKGANPIRKFSLTTVVFADWHQQYSQLRKRSHKRRFLLGRYLRKVWGLRRSYMVVRLVRHTVKRTFSKLQTFKTHFFMRLQTLVMRLFRIKSRIRAFMLVHTGHILVNGVSITNPNFVVKQFDVVSLSSYARLWVSELRRPKFIPPVGIVPPEEWTDFLAKKSAQFWRARKYKLRLRKSVLFGPRRSFAVMFNLPSYIAPSVISDRKARVLPTDHIRFLLSTLDF